MSRKATLFIGLLILGLAIAPTRLPAHDIDANGNASDDDGPNVQEMERMRSKVEREDNDKQLGKSAAARDDAAQTYHESGAAPVSQDLVIPANDDDHSRLSPVIRDVVLLAAVFAVCGAVLFFRRRGLRARVAQAKSQPV